MSSSEYCDESEFFLPVELEGCHPDRMLTKREFQAFLQFFEERRADVEALMTSQAHQDHLVYDDEFLQLTDCVPEELHDDLSMLFEVDALRHREEEEEEDEEEDVSFLPPSTSFELDGQIVSGDDEDAEQGAQEAFAKLVLSAERLALWFVKFLETHPQEAGTFLERLFKLCVEDYDRQTRLGLVEFFEQAGTHIRNGKAPAILPDFYQELIEDWRQCEMPSLFFDRDFRQQLGAFGEFLQEHVHHFPSSVGFLAKAKDQFLEDQTHYLHFEEGVLIPLYFVAFGMDVREVIRDWPSFQDDASFS